MYKLDLSVVACRRGIKLASSKKSDSFLYCMAVESMMSKLVTRKEGRKEGRIDA